MLEEFCHKNPELQNVYDDASFTNATHHVDDDDYSFDNGSGTVLSSSVAPNTKINPNNQPITNEILHTKKERSLSSSNNILVKLGDLTVRKGSAILSLLLKKHGYKTNVYGELSYSYHSNEKLVYLTIYQNRKNRKTIHTFILDNTCSFLRENKREFRFEHSSAIEYFTTETGTADSWIEAFSKTVNGDHIEEVYEILDESISTSTSSTSNYDDETSPVRPPPRPTRTPNPILPENIYVCLYDHYSTTSDSRELGFNRGDLLYIINTDGPNFYIARQLTLPIHDHYQNPIGLVYKDYIRPAYEKIS
ncbi:hypothetical protein I4U23_028533 [Adineta vaga]|nr:hypothetical protein I4U23_028533 [Adineta vaga]